MDEQIPVSQQTMKQQMTSFATSEHYPGAIELLKKCRTQLTSVVADTEFQTIVNALTLEIETNLIQRLIISIEKVRSGEQIED